MRRFLLILGTLAAVGVATPRPARAHIQLRDDDSALADSLIRAGRLAEAEALLYATVRDRPRNPEARLALGRYLAARGALKVGATLLEEARFFGGDARTVAIELAPVYSRLGDYRALASLPGSPLSAGERTRADYLRSTPFAISGVDSSTIVFLPSDSSNTLGTVTMMVGADTVIASIDPSVQGLVLDTAWISRGDTRTFPARGSVPVSQLSGVVGLARLGGIVMTNVPARFQPIGRRRARIGLDLVARLAPTFDVPAHLLTIRRSGSVLDVAGATHIPTMTLPAGPALVLRDGLFPLTSERARTAIRGQRWTMASKRGEIVLGK